MKKFIGELQGGEIISVRVNNSLTKSACKLINIEFCDDDEFEHALLTIESEEGRFTQSWYTTETIEVY